MIEIRGGRIDCMADTIAKLRADLRKVASAERGAVSARYFETAKGEVSPSSSAAARTRARHDAPSHHFISS